MEIIVFGNAIGQGGAQTAFRRLVDFLIAEGHSVGAIAIAQEADPPFLCAPSFYDRIDGSKLFQKVRQLSRSAIRSRGHKPGIFISVGLAKASSMIARFLPRRTFRVCQDFISDRALADPLLACSNRAFDAIAVQSPSMIGLLQEKGYSALPLSWLPCFPESPVEGFHRVAGGCESIRIAYFGRLAPNKGLDFFLRAFASLQFATPVVFEIWGRGNESDKLKQLAKDLNLGEVVRFCGQYPTGVEYAKLMCSYDGLVLPSIGVEGLPLILIEAMAYGVPFLTTRVGAIPDCCDDNSDAILVEPNLEALRAGLQEFVGRLIANTFSTERLTHYYQTHFSFDVMAQRWRSMLADPSTFFRNGK